MLLHIARRYGVPFVAVAAAIATRFYLDAHLGQTAPLLLFTLAVMVSSWSGGLLSGLIATALSLVTGCYLLIEPRYSFAVASASDMVQLFVFAIVGAGISVLSGQMQRSRTEAHRRKMEAARSEERFRLLVEGVADTAIFSMTPGGFIKNWNRGAERLTGYSADEAVGKHISVLHVPEEIADGTSERILRDAGSSGQIEVEGWRRRKDGTLFWADVTITALRDDAGRLRGFSKLIRDLTERHQHIAALERSEETTRKLLESASQAIIGVSQDGRIQLVNEMATRMFSFTRDELLGSQLEMLVPENLRSQHRSHRTAYAASPQTRPLVRSTVPSGRRKDGSEFPIEVSLSSIDTSEGKLSVAFITDITERKRAEDEVRRSERNLRDVLDSLFAFVGVMSVDGTLIETNRAPLEAAGISKEDVVGKPFWEAFWWNYSSGAQARIRASMLQARNGEASRFDIDMQMADGQVMTIDFMIAPMRDSAGAISRLISSAVPITERKRAEEALRRSEARLRRITESNIVGVLYWDLDGRVLDANEAFLRLAGYTRDDLEHGRADWKAITPAEWAGGDARGVSQLQATGKFGPYEKEFIRRDGTRVYALLAAAMFDTEPNRGVTLALDITHRKEAEDGLLRANEDLQQFAWAASHDLQEPIRMVVTFTQMLARRYGTSLDADGLELLGFAEDGAKRMEVLLHDLREYWHLSGTIEDEQRQQVNLSSVIDEVLRGLDAAIAGTDTHVSGVEDMPTVMGHRTGLVQLFQNLIGNAIKYRHPDRPLRVRLTAEREAGFWKFGVIDNGIGFPPEYRDRIFGIFKRLHGRDQYPGTGIGLALCRKIVSRHGGTIWADSDGHTGSSICFTLPAGAYRELAD